MRLTVLASGSSGNGYLFEGRRSALLVECGVKPEQLMLTAAVPLSRIEGALVSHEHGDHAGYVARYASLGIPVYASRGTLKAAGPFGAGARIKEVKAMQVFWAGEFKVMPFDVRHDAEEPLGFVIEHPEAGRVLFLTDTTVCPYDFRELGLDHILVEANYDDAIMDGNVANGIVEVSRAQRTRGTHMSLRQACELVKADQTAELKNVVLIHLSEQNADAREFARRMADVALFSRVHVARAGLVVELNKFEI